MQTEKVLDNCTNSAKVGIMSEEKADNPLKAASDIQPFGTFATFTVGSIEIGKEPTVKREKKKDKRRPRFRVGGSRYGEYFEVPVEENPTTNVLLEKFVEKLKDIAEQQVKNEKADNKRQAEHEAKQEEKAANDN